LSYGRSIS